MAGTLRAALEAIAARDPYPEAVFTPLTPEEATAVRDALAGCGVRHPLDRTYAAWARHVGAQYAELARAALTGEEGR